MSSVKLAVAIFLFGGLLTGWWLLFGVLAVITWIVTD